MKLEDERKLGRRQGKRARSRSRQTWGEVALQRYVCIFSNLPPLLAGFTGVLEYSLAVKPKPQSGARGDSEATSSSIRSAERQAQPSGTLIPELSGHWMGSTDGTDLGLATAVHQGLFPAFRRIYFIF